MTIELLNQTFDTYQEVQQIKEIIEEKRNMLKSNVITDMPLDHNYKDRICELVIRLNDDDAKYLGKLSRLINLQGQVETAIELLPAKERLVMRYRYIQGKTWDEIAELMHYCKRNITYIHYKAVRIMTK